MTEIIRAGQADSLGHIDTTQGEFRAQIDAITDAIRQLGGNPDISPGSAEVSDPLTSMFTLYVNPQIGNDKFVAGDYSSADDGSLEQKLKRISLQRLECGYSPARPFRTINRAVIEAAIITSRDWMTLNPAPCGDLVSIVLAPGVYNALNGDGTASVSAWTDGITPTDAQLTAFNPTNGGIVLPRGCSLISLDLRKTIIRPAVVPAPADEAADLSNRRAIFKITGGSYMYGFTIMDREGTTTSHHLLDGFQFAGQTNLDEFYGNIRTALSGVADISNANAVTRQSEYRITGPQPNDPDESVDTTAGASPYIYNVSLRSDYGMCGMLADGSVTTGFRSMVVAQYTGVSLQKDLTSWQEYDSGSWGAVSSYDDLIAESPNNIRFNPARRSYHVRTRNDSVIQEVSVFAIGQAIHHLAESGSRITITNSNSNFGGCAALATGFADAAVPRDTPWDIARVRRALSPFEKTNNIKDIAIGIIDDGVANNATTLRFTQDLNPDIVLNEGYTLGGATDYIWIDNPNGPNFRALLTATPWSEANPDQITIAAAVTTDNADGNRAPDGSFELGDIAGMRVYIRRLRDVRSIDERRYSVLLTHSGNERMPIRDYVIQPESGADWTERVQAVANVEDGERVVPGLNNSANVELRYSARAAADTDFDTNEYYRPTDTVRRNNKHWTARVNHYGPWDADNFDESYVHMDETSYAPEGYYVNAQPVIIFDGDNDQAEDSTTLGQSVTSGGINQAQLTSGVDYVGLHQFLQNLGVSATDATTLLEPQTEANRVTDVSGESWAADVEFRMPSTVTMFGHAFEWAGYSNYSKALPQYQQELSQSNQFTYYFTNEDGGKVYGSGFNQNGQLVTPRGLQDVTTGETLDLEEIANPDRPIDIPENDSPWTRSGTTLVPTNAGDQVTIVNSASAVSTTLEPDGAATFAAGNIEFAADGTAEFDGATTHNDGIIVTGGHVGGSRITGVYSRCANNTGSGTQFLRSFVSVPDFNGQDCSDSVNHFVAGKSQGIPGGGVTTGVLTGFRINSDINDGYPDSVQIKGFSGNIVSGSVPNRYNIFIEGSAPNYYAGNSYFGGAPTTLGTTTNIDLLSTGDARFAGNVTTGGTLTVTGNITGDNTFSGDVDITGSLDVTSAATFAANVTLTGGHLIANNDDKHISCESSDAAHYARLVRASGSPSRRQLKLRTTTSSSSFNAIEVVTTDPSTTVQWKVDYAGNASFRSVTGALADVRLQMDADNPAAYSRTMEVTEDEDGNEASLECSTYCGETESLLEIIRDLRARVAALEGGATQTRTRKAR